MIGVEVTIWLPYGAADEHVNTWLEQFCEMLGERPAVKAQQKRQGQDDVRRMIWLPPAWRKAPAAVR
jgi:hypothetical protein